MNTNKREEGIIINYNNVPIRYTTKDKCYKWFGYENGVQEFRPDDAGPSTTGPEENGNHVMFMIDGKDKIPFYMFMTAEFDNPSESQLYEDLIKKMHLKTEEMGLKEVTELVVLNKPKTFWIDPDKKRTSMYVSIGFVDNDVDQLLNAIKRMKMQHREFSTEMSDSDQT